ncbi:hypothetical protein ANN_03482 [Periplaneta americana]|uniref:Uncharacterized protein n=1 Tax=Periplaneta americana TaxID=6978 RepID=A0ABQ8U246_PERAM|nr:hypothetical protein ANN_03482 [Periplaneta americana]
MLRIQTEGLSGEYLEEGNTELRSQFHSLVALALKTPIFDYLEDNYVMVRRRSRCRQQPMCPPNIWNCCISTREYLPRTTNTCGAWLRHLNTLMSKAQVEATRIHQDIEKLEASQSPSRKKEKYTSLVNRFARIVDRYEAYRTEDNILVIYMP